MGIAQMLAVTRVLIAVASLLLLLVGFFVAESEVSDRERGPIVFGFGAAAAALALMSLRGSWERPALAAAGAVALAGVAAYFVLE